MEDKDKNKEQLLEELEALRREVVELKEAGAERKRAEEALKEEMEVTHHLLMIAEATAGTSDVDKLMEQVVHCSQKILGCGICLSYLWEKRNKVFRSDKESGLESRLVPLFRTEPIHIEAFREIFDGGKADMLTTLSAARIVPWFEETDVGTMVAIPLMGRKDHLGLILGIYQKSLEVTERDKRVMEGIAHQVSIALDEARLYKESIDRAMELSHKIETIQIMHEIDRGILSTLEPREILETVTRLIAKVIPCDRTTVVNVDKERQVFSWGAGFGTPFLEGLGFASFGDTSAGEIVRTGRTEYIANLTDIEEPLPIEAGLIKEGFLSHIRVPLRAKGEVIGLLSIGSKRPSAFTPENLATLEYLAAQVGVALENARLLSDLRELFLGTVKSLSSAIDAKSPWTAGHSERVTNYALEIGRELGLSENDLKDLELAGLLHDIGKIGTYEAILDKPGNLNDDERKVVRQHPVKGAAILAPIKQLKDVIPSIRSHHEFYDGTGYPDGLKGEAIPLFARILGVADTVDAMGADRPYRKGKSMDAAIAELMKCSGTQFDPKIVDAFLKVLGDNQVQIC